MKVKVKDASPPKKKFEPGVLVKGKSGHIHLLLSVLGDYSFNAFNINAGKLNVVSREHVEIFYGSVTLEND